MPRVLLPEAVGPTIAMIGFSDTDKYNDPDEEKQQEACE